MAPKSLPLPPFPYRIFLLPAMALPSAAFIAFLQNHPLDRHISSQIQTLPTLSPSCASSSSVRKLVSSPGHVALTDSFSIRVPKSFLHGLSDEQVLARLTKGFFGGVIFTPERRLLNLLGKFGWNLPIIPAVSFSDIPNPGPEIEEIPSNSLLPTHSLLFGGNVMVLDANSSSSHSLIPNTTNQTPCYIDIGFGNNRKSFVGSHRFEVSRDKPSEKGEEFATICFSSIACNPTANVPVFPGFLHYLHRLYATHLFRDGIREVLAE